MNYGEVDWFLELKGRNEHRNELFPKHFPRRFCALFLYTV